MAKIKAFVSHSTDDEKLVAKIIEAMRKQNIKPYLAGEDIKPGQLISPKIKQAIADSDIFVVILTENSKYSKWVQQEIGYAEGKVPIFPIKVGRVKPRAFLEGVECIPFNKKNLNRLGSLIRDTIKNRPKLESAISNDSVCKNDIYEVEPGESVDISLNVKKGDRITGRIEEEDGDSFDWYIVNEKNLMDFKNGYDFNYVKCGEDVVADRIRWTVGGNGPYSLILTAYRKQFCRMISIGLQKN